MNTTMVTKSLILALALAAGAIASPATNPLSEAAAMVAGKADSGASRSAAWTGVSVNAAPSGKKGDPVLPYVKPSTAVETRPSVTGYGQNGYGAAPEEDKSVEQHGSDTSYGQNSYGADSKGQQNSEANYGQNSYGTASDKEDSNEQLQGGSNYGQNSYGADSKGEYQHGGNSTEEHKQQREDSKETEVCNAGQQKQEENYGQNSYGAPPAGEQNQEQEHEDQQHGEEQPVDEATQSTENQSTETADDKEDPSYVQVASAPTGPNVDSKTALALLIGIATAVCFL